MWGPAPISARRLRALVVGIPLDGNVGREIGDPRATGWGNVEELLAALVEVSDAGNRLFFKAHAKKGTQAPKAIKVPRPERATGETEPVRRKRQATSEELRAFFGGSARYTGPPIEEIVPAGSGNEVDSAAEGVDV